MIVQMRDIYPFCCCSLIGELVLETPLAVPVDFIVRCRVLDDFSERLEGGWGQGGGGNGEVEGGRAHDGKGGEGSRVRWVGKAR